ELQVNRPLASLPNRSSPAVHHATTQNIPAKVGMFFYAHTSVPRKHSSTTSPTPIRVPHSVPKGGVCRPAIQPITHENSNACPGATLRPARHAVPISNTTHHSRKFKRLSGCHTPSRRAGCADQQHNPSFTKIQTPVQVPHSVPKG